MSDLITDVGERLHLCRLLRQLVSRLSQMASKVSQVCCRENLDWVRAWILQFLEDGQVGLSVIVEEERWPAGGSESVPKLIRRGPPENLCRPCSIPTCRLGSLQLGSRC